jgi:hypothetical protein
MKSEGRTLPKATPELARRVWEAQRRPSARTVARALTLGGCAAHYTTIARWKAQDWRPVQSDHPLEVARRQLEAIAPLLSGDPETSIRDLIDDPAHDHFDELTDAEVLRRAAREAAIATAIIFNAVKSRATRSEFDLPKVALALNVLARCVQALPSAFEQVINLDVADQRSNGFRMKP